MINTHTSADINTHTAYLVLKVQCSPVYIHKVFGRRACSLARVRTSAGHENTKTLCDVKDVGGQGGHRVQQKALYWRCSDQFCCLEINVAQLYQH